MGAGHSHSHDHGAGHSHAPADFGRAFAIGVGLNTAFVAVEAFYGLAADSMALIADAGHNLSDVLSLLLAWGASVAAKKPASQRYTYGYKSSTILAALANAMLLLIAIGMILVEAIQRFSDPQPVAAGTVMVVAGIGIVINTVTALLFMRGRKSDLNVRGAYLHMAADAAVSAGVVLAGAAIWWTGLAWIDPVTSIVIVAVIAWGTWGLLKESVSMALNAVPDAVDQEGVKSFLEGQDGVVAVHDLHIWPMSTTETAMTAHLVIPEGHPGDEFLRRVADELAHHHRIGHTTLQIECDRACATGC
ncbi:cation diffusion facilitator family transporter [Erythrobacter sp. LQ02-29]|uniref:cation diffusion facilitator family transporter n=1 Tax=Erythrobacter sp. LQ02-29 TaxID=2920384 RepID=UPI001F4E0677|nr:cation diffusion facilitator family transporter [Erythrobacter sp. LQ02-29]MCP9222426.1 cation diffusion facilitator family transporter [Erythrobacter sp. LQ02-29]